jgi:hypothetical protein
LLWHYNSDVPEPPQKTAHADVRRVAERVVLLTFGVALAVNIGLALGNGTAGSRAAANAILLTTGLLALLLALNRELPPQNVLVATAALSLGTAPLAYGWPPLLQPPEWASPTGIALVWITSVFGGRALAKLLLAPFQNLSSFGYCMLLISTCLVGLANLAAQSTSSATAINRNETLGWMISAGFTQILAAPWLLRKQPIPLEFSWTPLVVCGGLLLYVTALLAHQGDWGRALLSAALIGVLWYVGIHGKALRLNPAGGPRVRSSVDLPS